MQIRLAAVVSLALAATGVIAARGQTNAARPASAGIIDGVVSDTGLAPLSDATVTIVGTDIRVVTGADGRFRVVSVPAGQYVMLVRRIGYEPATAHVAVAGLDTLRVAIALEPAVTTLDRVTVAAPAVSPRLSEFYERRKVGLGQFLTQEEIEKQNAVRASDLFGRFMGLRLSSDGMHAFSMRGGPAINQDPRRCPVTAIVDGIAQDTNFSQLPSPKEIAAIEFYAGPSEIPLQYKSTRGTWCGLLLIWTRDGS